LEVDAPDEQRVAADAATAADDLSTRSVPSGRTDNWSAMFRDWRHDSVLEKAFGNIDNTRGYLLRQPASVKKSAQAHRRQCRHLRAAAGGVLGVLAFLLGSVLRFCRAFRRHAPAWWRLSVIGTFATVATSDQWLGSTGSTLLLLLTAGEVSLFGRQSMPTPRPAG